MFQNLYFLCMLLANKASICEHRFGTLPFQSIHLHLESVIAHLVNTISHWSSMFNLFWCLLIQPGMQKNIFKLISLFLVFDIPARCTLGGHRFGFVCVHSQPSPSIKWVSSPRLISWCLRFCRIAGICRNRTQHGAADAGREKRKMERSVPEHNEQMLTNNTLNIYFNTVGTTLLCLST